MFVKYLYKVGSQSLKIFNLTGVLEFRCGFFGALILLDLQVEFSLF